MCYALEMIAKAILKCTTMSCLKFAEANEIVLRTMKSLRDEMIRSLVIYHFLSIIWYLSVDTERGVALQR
ncbi:MAG: hypothetical protein IJ400_05320 [Clostridia bacterium]|nr:hypothetical protein [Clostridia bacterium]